MVKVKFAEDLGTEVKVWVAPDAESKAADRGGPQGRRRLRKPKRPPPRPQAEAEKPAEQGRKARQGREARPKGLIRRMKTGRASATCSASRV